MIVCLSRDVVQVVGVGCFPSLGQGTKVLEDVILSVSANPFPVRIQH